MSDNNAGSFFSQHKVRKPSLRRERPPLKTQAIIVASIVGSCLLLFLGYAWTQGVIIGQRRCHNGHKARGTKHQFAKHTGRAWLGAKVGECYKCEDKRLAKSAAKKNGYIV